MKQTENNEISQDNGIGSELFGTFLVNHGYIKPEILKTVINQQETGDIRHIGEILIEKGYFTPKEFHFILEKYTATQETKQPFLKVFDIKNTGLALIFLIVTGIVVYRGHHAEWVGKIVELESSKHIKLSKNIIEIPDGRGGIDRCLTCHRGIISNEFVKSNQPFLPHTTIEGHRDITRFGCTSCHGGQGRKIDMSAHKPEIGYGVNPFLKKPYVEAGCIQCHLPNNLVGAPHLNNGIQEYLKMGCNGCHQPGGDGIMVGTGSDLSQMGRRTIEEITEKILSGQLALGYMPNFDWRYGCEQPECSEKKNALIVAVLALGIEREPFRKLWDRKNIELAFNCEKCHFDRDRITEFSYHKCPHLVDRHDLKCKRCHAAYSKSNNVNRHRCQGLASIINSCEICHSNSKQN